MLSKALYHCELDNKCVGIWDGSCDNTEDFHICLNGTKTDISDYPGCVYKKSENHGT